MATTRQKNTSGEGTTATEDMVNEVKSTAGEALDQAKEKVSQAAGQVQQKAKTQLSERKDQVADGMDSVAHALRQTSQQLQDQDTGMVGNYVNKAADAISNISQHVREKDVDQLLHEVEGFARREPAIALGAAFAIGVIAARFLKSSNQRRYSSGEQMVYGNGGSQYGNQNTPPRSNHYKTDSIGNDTDSTRYPDSGVSMRTSNYSAGGMKTAGWTEGS